MRLIGSIAAVLAGLCASWAGVAATDLHAYWDGRCRSCHGDAGPFARSTLGVDAAGRLQGRHHAAADLDRFLRQHYLDDELVAPVTAMLVAQVSARPLFAQHCARCHGTAADFARKSLELRGGALVGKASGRPVDAFLSSHAGLPPEQAPEMVKALTRVLGEVARTP
jgi:hypothetical protein